VTALGAGAYQRGMGRSAATPPSSTVHGRAALKAQAAMTPVKSGKEAKTHPRLAQVGTVAGGGTGTPASAAAAPVAQGTGRPDSPELAALKAQRQTQRIAALKSFLTAHNVTEEKAQSLIIEQVLAQEEARRQLQEAGRQLFPVMGRQGMPPATEQQTATQIAAYEKAVLIYRDARQKSAEALEKHLAYSKTPRLRALLLALGLIGEAPPVISL